MRKIIDHLNLIHFFIPTVHLAFKEGKKATTMTKIENPSKQNRQEIIEVNYIYKFIMINDFANYMHSRITWKKT